MKVMLILAFLATANTASWRFIKDINRKDVDNLIMDSINKYREEWRAREPIGRSDFSSCFYKNDDSQVDVSLKNISESLGSGLAYMETSEVTDQTFYAYVQIIQKNFKLEGIITINGTFNGENVQKSGQFTGIYNEIRQDISVEGSHNKSSTFLNEIKVNNTFGKVDVKTNLKIETQFNKFLSQCVHKNMVWLDRKTIRNIPKLKEDINNKIKNMNLYDSFNLLKNEIPHKVFAPIILFNT